MTSAKRRLLLIVIMVMLVASIATAGMLTAFAVTTTDTIEYPFRTGGVHMLTRLSGKMMPHLLQIGHLPEFIFQQEQLMFQMLII